MTRFFNVAAAIALTLSLVGTSSACGIWGQLFCDYCWDGQFTSGTDSNAISGAKVFVNCTVKKDDTFVYFWGTDNTASDGKFETAIAGASHLFGKRDAEAAFLFTFFKNSAYRQGMLPNVQVVGCSVSVSNAPSSCPTLSLNDGVFLTNGKKGNGWTSSNAFIAQYQSTDLADIYIGSGGSRSNSVSLTPSTRGAGSPKGCPASPPPPPGLTGDPHFTGADGSHFDFTGEPGNNYCLVSDAHVHVNAFYGGRFDRWGDNPSKALTWIRQLGILWGGHRITLAARAGPSWRYDSGYMGRVAVDGEEVALSREGDSASFASGAVEISWLAAKLPSADDLVDVYLVKIAQAFIMRLTLRPEIELLRTPEDGVVHFDVEFPKVDVSDKVHGVLGQTFRSDHRFRLTKQQMVYSELLRTEVVPGDNAEGFLDGSEKDYRSSGLLSADCKVARFVGASSRDEEVKKGVQLTSGTASSVYGKGRKMLKAA